MAISLKTAGTWAELTADGAVTIPGSPAAGDRMFLFATWKDFSVTATVSNWTAIGAEFTDGAVAVGNGTGSMKVQAWYRDWVTGDGNPTVDFSASPNIAGVVINLWQKGATELWQTPTTVTAAWPVTATTQTVSASSTTTVPADSVVMALIGIRDDSAAFTRATTTGIDVSAGVTWAANYSETPATHLTTTTGFDMAADLGHRLVTTGGTGLTLRVTATISAVETGAIKWIVQGLSRPSFAQAQASIKAFNIEGVGQAQAKLNTFGVNRFAQARAYILNPRFGQAQARILQTYPRSIDSIIFYDSFTGSNGSAIDTHAPDIIPVGGSSTWAIRTNYVDAQIEGNRFTSTSDATSSINIYDVGQTNYILEANMEVHDSNANNYVELRFRSDNVLSLNLYSIELINNGANSGIRLNRVVNNTPTILFQDLTLNYIPYQIKIIVNGTSFEFFIDGVSKGTYSDTNHNDHTYIEIHANAQNLSGSRSGWIDNVTVTLPNSAQIGDSFAQAQALVRPRAGYAQAQAFILSDKTGYAQAMARIGPTRYERILRGISGLASFWTFGEPDSSNGIHDYYGGVNGVGAGTFSQPSVNPLQLEPGIKFNSSDEYIEFGDDYDFAPSGAVSYIGWIKYNGTLSGDAYFLSKASSQVVGTNIGITSGDITLFRDGSGTGRSLVDTVDNTWIFFYISTNGTTHIIGTNDSYGAGNTVAVTNVTNNLTFGRRSHTVNNSWTGSIASFTIFNAGISFDDIQALYTVAKSGAIVRPGQAQALIKVTDKEVVAQAQANILQTYKSYAQAQANIIIKGFSKSQAGALINGLYGLPFRDTFTRSVTNGLGTSDNGDAWVLISGDVNDGDVTGTKLTIVSDSGTSTVWDLKQTLAFVNGVEYSGQVEVNKLASSTESEIDFGLKGDNATNLIGPGFSVTPTLLRLGFNVVGGGTSGTVTVTYIPNDIYNFKVQAFNILSRNVISRKSKLWKVGDIEPGWTVSSDFPDSSVPLNHIRIRSDVSNDANQPFTWTFDNLQIIEAWPTQYAQAQARIKQTYNAFSQAQAEIVTSQATYQAYAQTQAQIKQTYNGFAQAQAQIKQTYNSFAQSQARILTTYNAFAQTQADIKQTYQSYAQSQAWIEQTYNSFAQAQARILQVYNGYSQAQGQIKQTYTLYAQAQAEIKQTYNSFAQAQALITDTYEGFAQAQARILAVSNAYAQAQARILTTYNSFGQAQAQLRAFNVEGFGQALANIKGTDQEGVGQAQAKINAFDVEGCGQSQAQIKQTYNSFAQAQAEILQSYTTYGQAQANIIKTYNEFAQAQVQIKQTYQGYGQARARILQTSNSFAQSQADIKQTYNGYGQSQSDIKQTYNQYAQSQADILVTYNGYAQAQASILAVGSGYGQAQGQIKQTYNSFAQAQGTILQTYQGYANAQAEIKQTYQSYGQAQADIKQTYQNYAQAQATVLQTYQSYAQAQALILRTEQGYGQTQGTILQVYYSFAQSQASILAVGYGFAQTQAQLIAFGVNQWGQAQGNIAGKTYPSGQAQGKINAYGVTGCANSQAQIKQTYNEFGQAQGTIKQTYNSFAQAQSDILVVTNGHGQAQGEIKQTYIVHAQAQADIKVTTSEYGQSQGTIKSTNASCANAQADIKTTYRGYAQAQAVILGAFSGYGQSQASIRATSVACAQTQADIKQTYNSCAQAQTYIRRTDQGYSEAQAVIKQVYNSYAQAQARILQTYNGYGQAQGRIKQTYNGYAQAQSYIKITGQGYGQAQGLIVTGTAGYAQAQASVKATQSGLAQAQAHISVAGYSFAQAQAYVLTKIAIGMAQAYIKALHLLKKLALSDRESVHLMLSDRNSTQEEFEDNLKIGLVLSDRESPNMGQEDTLVIRLTLFDRNYEAVN